MEPRSADEMFVVRGEVVLGDQRGRTIGFPTANVGLEHSPLADGVWAGWLECRGQRRVAAISIGSRPTFYACNGIRLAEAHVLDFDEDIYGEVVTVWMCAHLRDQMRFGSVDDLVVQLHADVAATRVWATAPAAVDASIAELLATVPMGRALAIAANG